ncbi:MAG: DUF2079 domain-containing protein [Candidatus Brocadiae bacterium]|nr:DUF2079 domain-containing protein [Candidatus Brocadiia bacterium]
MTRAPRNGTFLPACLVALAVASGALSCAFYFRGAGGDFNLHNIIVPEAGMNEYYPPDASATLVFPRLGVWLGVWGVVVVLGWLLAGRVLTRRDGLARNDALARAARIFTPLIALLLVPAHHFLGLPFTLAPAFLLILCVGLSAAVAGHLLAPKLDGRLARGLFSVWSVWGLAVAYSVAFSILMCLSYWALNLGYLDSGTFAETVFQLSQGNGPLSNFQPGSTVLSVHWTLILVPIGYLYKLWPHHELLLVLQSVSLGVGGVAVYLLAKSVLRDRFVAWAFAVAYFLAATTAYVNLPTTYGFRPLTFLMPALLFAMVCLERGRAVWYFVCLLLALLCKEEAAPAVVMLGVFVAARHRRWVVAGATVALGIGWFVLATQAMKPLVPAGQAAFPTHLSKFGLSAGEVLRNVAADPLRWLAIVFDQPVKVFFLLHLLVPLLLLPVLSPWALLVGMANFVILTMTGWYGKYIILIGPQAPVMPGVYLAAVFGLKNLADRDVWPLRRMRVLARLGDRTRVVRAAGWGLLVAALLTHYLFFLRTMPWERFVVPARARTVRELRQKIPRDTSLCASYRLASHFTDQQELWVARDEPEQPGVTCRTLLQTEYVVLDLYDSWVGLPTIARYRNDLLRSRRYAPIFARDGFLVFRRGGEGLNLRERYVLREPCEPKRRYGEALADGFATLLGYDVAPAEAGLALALYWRCEAPRDADYAVQLTLRAVKDGKPQQLGWRYAPCDGVVPTWQWKTGDVMADRLLIPGIALPDKPGRFIADAVLDPIREPKY